MKIIIASLALALTASGALAGQYKRVSPSEMSDMELAKAECEIATMNVYTRGGFIIGDSTSVGLWSLGHGIGTMIKRDRAMKNCMRLKGWKYTSTPSKKSKSKANYNPGS